MAVSLVVAFISAVSALAAVGMTYYLTKQREQEIEWRKLKLEHYRAYFSALSGVVSSRSTAVNQLAYADATNNLQLVAPETVLLALYNYQDAIRYNNNNTSANLHNQALTSLLQAMRADVHPSLTHKNILQFRLFDVPPEK